MRLVFERVDARGRRPQARQTRAGERLPGGPAPAPDRDLTILEPIIHIIEDDAGLRLALARLFRSVSQETRLYASAQEFFSHPWTDHHGCLLIDVQLPGINGLDLHAKLAEAGVSLPAILMTGFGDIPMSVRAMKAGAVDFLPKPFVDQAMLDAVAVALERDQKRHAADSETRALRDRLNTLTQRERQVFEIVVTGRLNKQIAGDLGLSEITIKIHRGSAMRKMGARSLAELVRMAQLLNC